MKTNNYNFRINKDLKHIFKEICLDHGIKYSKIIRESLYNMFKYNVKLFNYKHNVNDQDIFQVYLKSQDIILANYITKMHNTTRVATLRNAMYYSILYIKLKDYIKTDRDFKTLSDIAYKIPSVFLNTNDLIDLFKSLKTTEYIHLYKDWFYIDKECIVTEDMVKIVDKYYKVNDEEFIKIKNDVVVSEYYDCYDKYNNYLLNNT